MSFSELLRFGVVGLLQNGLNVASFAFLLALDLPYRAAAVVAAVAALLASFQLNRQWTFRSATAEGRRLLARYVLVFGIATGVGVLLLWAFVEGLGWPKVLAQTVAVAVVAPLSYVAQRTFTFAAPATIARASSGKTTDAR